MTGGDLYRVKAAEHRARAATEHDAVLKAELEHLAQSYLRLAEQAERNSIVLQNVAALAAGTGDPETPTDTADPPS